MTVIRETITTPTGELDKGKWLFTRVLPLSEDDDGDGIVNAKPVRVAPVDGVINTPDLEPGDYIVAYGANRYPITVPNSATPIRLWPLIHNADTGGVIDGGTPGSTGGSSIDGGTP